MAIVTAKDPGNLRPRRQSDPYSVRLRQPAPAQIDVYHPASLGGLGDLGDTGIPLIDDLHKQIDEAALYAKITAACSVVSGVASAYLLYLALRRR
jgi:hypothetical protein